MVPEVEPLLMEPPVPELFWLPVFPESVPDVEPLSIEPVVPDVLGVALPEPLMSLGPEPTVPWVDGAPLPAVAVPVCAKARAGEASESATTAA